MDGEVFAFDRGTKLLVLQRQGTTPSDTTFRIINTANIKEIASNTPGEGALEQELPVIDLPRSRAREDRAVQVARADVHKIGVGVTRQAQQLFDALSRTLPCRWDGKKIVVLEEVGMRVVLGC